MSEGIITIKAGREKPIRSQHPWIFSGAIARAENAVDGELVTVCDSRRRFLARDYWNSKSQIQVRLLTWRDEPIDSGWWQRMLQRALALRQQQGFSAADQPQRACRAVHAENDFIPGLVIDRYGDWAVLQALTRYIDRHKTQIAALFSELTGSSGVFERSDVDVRRKEGLPAAVGVLSGGQPSQRIEIRESARYLVDIAGGHKTGFYLDQRDSRRLLRRLVRAVAGSGAVRLADVFSYSGGFTLAARSGAAVQTVSVDSSRAALELARENHRLNGFDDSAAEWIQADGFDYLRACVQQNETFDIVVLDPPKFAPGKAQVRRAARGYKDLNMNAAKIIQPGGYLMTFSCSSAVSRDLFQKIVFGALSDAGRQAQIVRHLSAAADHPSALTFPEGNYLKGLLLRLH